MVCRGDAVRNATRGTSAAARSITIDGLREARQEVARRRRRRIATRRADVIQRTCGGRGDRSEARLHPDLGAGICESVEEPVCLRKPVVGSLCVAPVTIRVSRKVFGVLFQARTDGLETP